MDSSRLVLTILGVAILAVAGWLAIRSVTESITLSTGWEAIAGDPLLIGDSADPFAYAGDDGVRAIDGDARLQLTKAEQHGLVRVTVALDEEARLGPTDRPWIGNLTLRSRIDENAQVWNDVTVHGETGLGDPRLPETEARLAGESRFELLLDEAPLETSLDGLWVLGNALRRDDGAIRNRGLIFSPLLRDDTIFADPDRLELTLLLYESDADDDRPVVLQLVFREVDIVASPRPSPTAD